MRLTLINIERPKVAVAVIGDRGSVTTAAAKAAETRRRKITVLEKDYTKAPTYERDSRQNNSADIWVKVTKKGTGITK